MSIGRYRKKPVVVEAVRWEPQDLVATGRVCGWLSGRGADFEVVKGSGQYVALSIITLEGAMTAQDGDWIIRGVQGEFYPCKADIFDATYEAA